MSAQKCPERGTPDRADHLHQGLGLIFKIILKMVSDTTTRTQMLKLNGTVLALCPSPRRLSTVKHKSPE